MRARTEDTALLLSWRGGDQAAGDELARKHYAAVFRFFEVKATAVADDLTQRTFLACLQSIERLQRAQSFRSFLFGIARNQLLRHIERRERREDPGEFDDTEARPTRLSMLVARAQEQQIVLRAMAELPDDQLQPLQLYYWEDMHVAEIADALALSTTAVTSRLHRARQRLREIAVALAHRPELRARLTAELDTVTRSIASTRAGAG